MDALVAYGSGSEESDNNGEQQQKQANHEIGDIIREISVSETSSTDVPSSRVPLPLELNCEIFKCLKLPIQRKFIWGLGRDIYGMFGQKLLKKTNRVRNPHGNTWNGTNRFGFPNVFAEQGFPISGQLCRVDEFPGTICYYYEIEGRLCDVGLSAGAIFGNLRIGQDPNSYAISTGPILDTCWLAGEQHHFELPEGVDRPRRERNRINVHGCGLVLDPEDNLWIFFTLNGQLLGQKIQISPTVDRLFPTICLDTYTINANFGNDPAKPFEYDIQKCLGLGLAFI